MRHLGLPCLLVVVMLAAGCAGQVSPAPGSTAGPSSGPTAAAPSNAAGIVEARADIPRAAAAADLAPDATDHINAFGFDYYQGLASHPGNLVFSPASIEFALSMARAGAKGKTATQMDTVMHNVGADAGGPALNALEAALASRNGTFEATDGTQKPVALHVANKAFAQRGLAFVPDYLDTLASRFGAGVGLVDYQQDAEGARGLINRWVSDQTEQRIPELLPKGTLDALTRLVLVNAIYLKAPWLNPFIKDATQKGSFTTDTGKVVQADLMSGTIASLPYARGNGWQLVELPYLGSALAMDMLVPDDLAAFDAGQAGAAFTAATSALTPHMVQLTLPKFDIQFATDLAGQLASMGMPLAFDPNHADFSGMTTQAQLYISAVLHQANITVDESGTEAAAATAVVLEDTSMPADVITLRVDKPFLFAVRDVSTDAILFLGRLVDPTAPR